MKLELLIAFKYLIPRKKRLSSAVVSIFSIGIISLVTWLSIVFISVIYGLEQRWIHDLSQLHSPIKISPSAVYYDSYYYQVDRHADLSQYTTKTIREKLASPFIDPYDPDLDYSLPENFPIPDTTPNGELKDPVKIVFESLTPYLNQNQAQLLEFEEGIGYVQMDRIINPSKSESRTFSQFVAYHSDKIYKDRVLPYDHTDYSSEILNLFNNSNEGWGKDFENLQNIYRGSSVILPTNYRDIGYRVGDKGNLSIFSPETQKEIQHPVYVIGFYNPGLSPMGSKIVFIDMDLASLIRSESTGLGMHNGLHVFFPSTKQINPIKNQIQTILNQADVDQYWEVSSLYDYQYFKPILDQLRSDQVLFLLVSIIILIVACSNVVTMSILLVNNKKKEIGILKAMGTPSRSLKVIFSFCGALSGAIGAVLGTTFAIITMKNLSLITRGLSYLQGREAFNSTFFGQGLPQEIHIPTIVILGLGTLILAAISGALPARKVAKMHVSDILKAE
ncbi:Lipoprotein-releasing system transmembrane protein lolE,outer membrane-specific lipoprotein transporter subunit LolE,lipoprotein releasing system, transmembrane protein, LolC/E family,FtsX-like permease family [Chlamydia poikilotherma]|uniref:ABC3 transporter permease C-terminal domain-containing protein n=1 Tax=Chlamydia poikilotherma TaxID=1967783 RepID=A0A3B0PSP6_9CHLA|nr:FtsX-like permease family protein [Chlamydia poikilotherma]SYX09011.1 Lipoprotein-releasing system transmembrane protein lolE,outer membrane-specific lipoprotein transporter subunit LolE,lipoprotein releasing system, transmembrane protein, LolC/E family,FtsX-like permease family [Chlamydia poikilotherma]